MGPLKQFVYLIIVTVSLILMPVTANAYQVLTCQNDGTATPNTSLFDADKQTASGECAFYNDPAVLKHIFSLMICDFIYILNQIMDNMYCGINFYLYNMIGGLLTLYVTIYGAQILMGTAQLSTRDSLTRILKLSFVYVFSTQSAWGIGYTFRFFMAFITDASAAVMNVLATNVAATNDGVCNFDGLDPNNVMSMYSFLDYLVCHALLGPVSEANTKVQGFFLTMVFALPPMTMLFQWWIMTTLKTLVQTLVAFLKCLAAIAFLVALGPMFLGFYLFQSTAYVFENWLRYLIAFSVQIVLVLSIVVFWIMTLYQFVWFFNSLSDMIFPRVFTETVGADYNPEKTWGICPPKFDTSMTGMPLAYCEGRFDANPPPCEKVNGVMQCGNPTNPNWEVDNKKLIAPEKVINQGDFLYFIFYHIFTLLLISYCFSILLEKTDDIARSLAGPIGVPALVPGFGNSIGDSKNFKAPAFAGNSADGSRGAAKVGADFHQLVKKR